MARGGAVAADELWTADGTVIRDWFDVRKEEGGSAVCMVRADGVFRGVQ